MNSFFDDSIHLKTVGDPRWNMINLPKWSIQHVAMCFSFFSFLYLFNRQIGKEIGSLMVEPIVCDQCLVYQISILFFNRQFKWNRPVGTQKKWIISLVCLSEFVSTSRLVGVFTFAGTTVVVVDCLNLQIFISQPTFSKRIRKPKLAVAPSKLVWTREKSKKWYGKKTSGGKVTSGR